MAVYQDGSIPSGSPVITINNTTFKANSFSFPNDSANTTNIQDENGQHAAAISIFGPTTGSAQLQLATSSTLFPQVAAANSAWGTFTVPSNGSNVNCFITSCTIQKPAAGPWLADIQFQKKMN
jgi:hypothetical protein